MDMAIETAGFFSTAGYFIVVLGILVFVHELGHFLAAKSVGVRVLKFSLGFGPKLIGKKIGHTDYMISMLPLGGYVKMLGENLHDEIQDKEKSESFLAQNNFKKSVIVVAGPLFNFIFAVVAYWAVFMIGISVPVDVPVVGSLSEGYPAAEAGLMTGDRIVSINGEAVESWEGMSEMIRASGGSAVELKVLRGDEEMAFSITPKVGEGIGEDFTPKEYYMIGISPTFELKRYGPIKAVDLGLKQTGMIIRVTFKVIGKMFSGDIPLNNIGGPILIAQVAGEAGRGGLAHFLGFLALISINLGILNLLPVPVLDGGHLLFFIIESVIRRPISLKVKEVALQIGLLLLVLLMIMAFYFDIARIISPG
ncbi:MAG: RIP metalloprotease RseP [Deltaproteobacteria bacterium]|uniref:Zinc metalloprotease n=1 Tax=Candidatus Zymogenus saltonus TaxID=2844893 RepID=A0A9D8PM11_9DELT|nr:RIP metalloprotease RseP [Candidatus Zymogenus saltonus]